MTPTPPSATPSSGGHSPEDQFRVVRKRNRVPLSCYPCRTRKLKCDRGHPCANCVKRDGSDAASCSYATPSARKKNPSHNAASPDDMQNRIDRLEGLVLTLMHGGVNIDISGSSSSSGAAAALTTSTGKSTSAGTSPAVNNQDNEEVMDDYDSEIEEDLASSLGVLKVDSEKGKSMYIGQEHWHTVLADISEVRNYFATHKKDLEKSYEKVLSSKPVMARQGLTLLLGASKASDVELRAELPPKSSILTLCGRYFNSLDNAVNIIHGPTFQKQLRAHWQDPSQTPIMWLGLVYAVMCLAMLSYHKGGDEPPEWKGRSLEMAAEFRLRTVQCLITGDYTKPVEYTVETMILYVFGEYSSQWDADLGLWLIMSLVTRISLRMGYHRDAKWFPSLTPFQAEMRRRTWALVRMSDIIFSHQVSLPSMINDHDCDTQLPTNIFDDEFGPETKTLPPSRPASEATPTAYMISKAKLCIELGNIIQTTNRVGKQVPYEEILRFDAKMREIHAELPPHLRLRSLESSHDPVSLIIARFNIDILYLKILCLLHRKYLPRARQNARYAHSRRTAIEASLAALEHLRTLHQQSQLHGRLRSLKWYITSISMKDFMLPAVLVMLELHFENSNAREEGRRDSENALFWTPAQRLDMIQSLERTGDIWKGLADTSVEAYKASAIIQIMLAKYRDPTQPQGTPDYTATLGGAGDDPAFKFSSSDMRPPREATAAASQGAASDQLIPDTASLYDRAQGGVGSANPNMAFYPPGMSSTGMTADFQGQGDFLGPNNPGSPFSMFTTFDGTGADLTGNIDWDAFENYAQSANWGADQSFQVFAGSNPTPGGSNDNPGFTFDNS